MIASRPVAEGKVTCVDTVACVCGSIIQCSRAQMRANNGRAFVLNIYAKHLQPDGSPCADPKEASGGVA